MRTRLPKIKDYRAHLEGCWQGGEGHPEPGMPFSSPFSVVRRGALFPWSPVSIGEKVRRGERLRQSMASLPFAALLSMAFGKLWMQDTGYIL